MFYQSALVGFAGHALQVPPLITMLDTSAPDRNA